MDGQTRREMAAELVRVFALHAKRIDFTIDETSINIHIGFEKPVDLGDPRISYIEGYAEGHTVYHEEMTLINEDKVMEDDMYTDGT